MKKIITGALAIGAASAMMMTAFAGEVTVDDVLANYAEASASASGFTATATAEGNVAIEVPEAGETMAFSADLDLDMAYTQDPLAVSATGTANVDLAGSAIGVGVEMYMVPEDDTTAVYAKVSQDGAEDETIKTVIDADDTAQILALMQSSSLSLADLPLTFTLADEQVDVNGVSCYALTSTVTAEDLPTILSSAMEAINSLSSEAAAELPSEDDLSMVTMLASGLQLNLEIDVDAETYLPMYCRIDMDGSDYTMLGTLFASMQGLTKDDGSMYEVNISADPLYIEYSYQYPEDITIEVPAEIVESAQEVDASELEDAATEIAG